VWGTGADDGPEVRAERSRSTGKRYRARRDTGRQVKIKTRFPQPCNLGATGIPAHPRYKPVSSDHSQILSVPAFRCRNSYEGFFSSTVMSRYFEI